LRLEPEFEAAAKELEGKVRFVKLDTEKEASMASKLGIAGLPTLLFLDEIADGSGPLDGGGLLARVEGAIMKDHLISLCDQHFFGAGDDLAEMNRDRCDVGEP